MGCHEVADLMLLAVLWTNILCPRWMRYHGVGTQRRHRRTWGCRRDADRGYRRVANLGRWEIAGGFYREVADLDCWDAADLGWRRMAVLVCRRATDRDCLEVAGQGSREVADPGYREGWARNLDSLGVVGQRCQKEADE